MDLDELCAFALALPGTTREPHFERWSLRVSGKIFATFEPGAEAVNLFFPEERCRELAGHGEVRWGQRLVGARVRLDAEDLRALVEEAWRRKAPRRLVAARAAR